MISRNSTLIWIAVCLILVAESALAQRGGGGGGGSGSGGIALGVAGGIVAVDQSDVNELINRANTREGGISTSELGNGMEGTAFVQYRLSGSFLALQLRPSFFFQKEKGKNSSGEVFEYSVVGYTIFPTARFYMLEDDTIKFFSQVGIGMAFVDGVLREGAAKIDYSGNDLGYFFGLGAEFCFGSHCVSIEGNLRYLKVARIKSDSFSGTAFDSGSITQPSSGTSPDEVELDDRDLFITLSGVQSMLGYAYHF